MHRLISIVLTVAVLSGCTAANDAADAVARNQAKSVVNGIITERFPRANVTVVTDCVIDSASAGEIIKIASASATGVKPSTVQLVKEIVQRPDTINCMADESLALLGF